MQENSSQVPEEKANEPRKVRELHNSHFIDPLFELSRIEHEIGQYSTIQYSNLFAKYNLVIV